MTTYYVDSSALVKRYVNEIGSNWVQTLCDPAARHVLALAHIGRVEVAAALGIKERQGILPTKIRDALIHDLEQDARHQYWLIDVDHAIVTQAIALTRRQKLRGYDAVHLAAALFLQTTLMTQGLLPPILVSADTELLTAAEAEGLTVENPHNHPNDPSLPALP